MRDLSRRGLLKSVGTIVAACVGASVVEKSTHNASPMLAEVEDRHRCSQCGHPVSAWENHIRMQWVKWQTHKMPWNRSSRSKAESTAYYHPRCAEKIGIKTLYDGLYNYNLT